MDTIHDRYSWEPPRHLSIAELYHENSKSRRISPEIPPFRPDYREDEGFAGVFKAYNFESRVTLPPIPAMQCQSLAEVIRSRRSVREFSGRELAFEQVSALLQLGNGETLAIASRKGQVRRFRAAPTAGMRYPIEIYPIVLRATGLPRGIWYYNVPQNALELLKPGAYTEILNTCLMGGGSVALQKASVVFVMTAVFGRTMKKYGARGYRFILLEAGHIAENMWLAATALGVGFVTIGGFIDDELNALLDLDGVEEAAVYLTVAGDPADFCRETDYTQY